MRHLVLGTAGHIDHGKTALVRALTGTDTDRLPEEKRRGITIDLGFAQLLLPGLEYAVVDVPGHESLVRNMLAGASGIDVVLLVVAADEGVMPQTREHLAIMELLAVPEAVVALTKSDLVAPDWLELVCEDVRAELAGSPFGNAPLVPVSAVSGAGLERLRQELLAAAERCPSRATEDLFRMPIDRAFTVRGTGTVVTGTIWSGLVRPDSMLRALPGDIPVRVRGLQRHGAPAAEAGAGERVALAVALPADALQRGITLVDYPDWPLTTTLTVDLQVLPDSPPLKYRQRLRLHLGTAETMARVVSLGPDPLPPGGRAWAQLRLEAPVSARAGDRFVLRSYSPVRTIAGGIVVEPAAPKRKRLSPITADLLEQIRLGRDRVSSAVRLAGRAGVPVRLLPIVTGLRPRQLAVVPAADAVAAGDRLYPADLARDLRERLLAMTAESHRARPLEPGMSREELRRMAPEAAPQLIDQLLSDLVAERQLVTHGAAFASPGFEPALSPEQQRLAAALLQVLRDAGLAAPRLSELPPEIRLDPHLPALARHLARQGQAVPVAHDLLADPAAIRAAAVRLKAAFAARERHSASSLKEVLGLTRKHLIPLLEYFDRVGITRRDGDDRVAGAGLQTASGEGS